MPRWRFRRFSFRSMRCYSLTGRFRERMSKHNYIVAQAVNLVVRNMAPMDSTIKARLLKTLYEEAQKIFIELLHSGKYVDEQLIARKLSTLIAQVKYQVPTQVLEQPFDCSNDQYFFSPRIRISQSTETLRSRSHISHRQSILPIISTTSTKKRLKKPHRKRKARRFVFALKTRRMQYLCNWQKNDLEAWVVLLQVMIIDVHVLSLVRLVTAKWRTLSLIRVRRRFEWTSLQILPQRPMIDG